MKTPKMILFDYGHTLLYEPAFDFLRGERTLTPYITQNRSQLSPEQINDFANTLYIQAASGRKCGVELHERQFQRMVYESLGITFSIGFEEIELIKWNAASPGAMVPQADMILDCINRCGIRSGVISNIGWSEHALTDRFNRLLPRHRFEFIIASSEYGFRKPSHYLFELALGKAGLSPEDVWFCGDNPQADIEGAAQVGMYPVWYDNPALGADTECRHQSPPACEHLRIHAWDELIRVLEALNKQA